MLNETRSRKATRPAGTGDVRTGLVNGVAFATSGIGGASTTLITKRLLGVLEPTWALQIISILTLATKFPAAWLIASAHQQNVQLSLANVHEPRIRPAILSGAIATFPLFVPPSYPPLCCQSIGLEPSVGAAMVASFNFSSAIGRIGLGLLCDFFGPLNMLFVTLLMIGSSMLVLWPFSNSLAPLVVFAIWNGVASGGFFPVMPTIVGGVFASQKMPIVMIPHGWSHCWVPASQIWWSRKRHDDL
jgi:MFS family permease